MESDHAYGPEDAVHRRSSSRDLLGHFATNTLARLSKLSVWWVRLGVLPEFIEPGKPQQNGRHERMHRTLKADTTRPPAGSCRAQQRKFNCFREEFNQERPHEALDMHTPASCYESSPREMPNKLPPRSSTPIGSRCAT
jgi:transposase InsO family protein